VLFCEKDPELIKQCIRVNRDVSITLYRDHRIGFGYGDLEQAARLDHEETGKEIVPFPAFRMKLA